MAFALWWHLVLMQPYQNKANFNLDQFHRVANKPFGILYIIHFVAHLILAHSISHKMSPWLQFFVFGMGSILMTYIYQTVLVYPWHKRLAGETPERFIKSALAYLRLLAALFAPFCIFQLLNSTLIDPPVGSIDAFEVLVLSIGRIVVLSLLTIVFSVMFMLKMIPNSSIKEEDYLDLIQKRIDQIGWENVRLRWINIPNFNNAFVVGFKWFGFSNQTMFIGKSLRDLLTRDEFDAVICHELGHMASGHLLKRITYGLALLFGLVVSLVSSLIISMILTFVLSNDPATSALIFGASLLFTLVGSYMLIVSWMFRNYRQQEHEADAFAVMKLGIKVEDLENSLRKVSQKFLQEARKKKIWNPFSTHPEIETRIENVREKISRGVDYDWNQSVFSRLMEVTFRAASPRALAMSFSLFILTGLLIHTNVMQNKSYLSMIERADMNELKNYKWHDSHINSRLYLLFGTTPLELAVYKTNMEVVRFLISRGADVAKGSGFNSPVDVALNQKNWKMLNYLLKKLPETWIAANANRLIKMAVVEDSGEAIEVLFDHKLYKYLDESSFKKIVERISVQDNEKKNLALQKARLKDPSRQPASE